jgi:hypothetical protein
MPASIKLRIIIVFIIVFSSSVLKVFAQDLDKPTQKINYQTAFEQALKNYERSKEKDQEELIKKLNTNLDQIAQDWINQVRKEKEPLVGTRYEQSWEKLATKFPISKAHYDYYLRGYKYFVIKNDIRKSDSINYPYNANLIIGEDLYVERNHSPDISDANPYFYTISTIYNLYLEYRQDKFTIISSNYEITDIKNDAPVEMKKFRL